MDRKYLTITVMYRRWKRNYTAEKCKETWCAMYVTGVKWDHYSSNIREIFLTIFQQFFSSHYSSRCSVTTAVTILAAAVTKQTEKRSGTFSTKCNKSSQFSTDKAAFNIGLVWPHYSQVFNTWHIDIRDKSVSNLP